MSPPSRGLRVAQEVPVARDLLELAADTRALAQKLDAGLRENPERLSVAAFNEAFARLLRNQVAILETLAGLTGVHRDGPVSAPVPADAASASSDELDAASDVLEDVDELEDDDGEDDDGEDDDAEDGADTRGGASGPRVPVEALASPEVSARRIEGAEARPFVEAFDNRDKSYNRGLDKLNHWIGGGTPFQYRGARAYLNASGLGPEGIARFEEMLMGRMGFDTRLGILIVEGLAGDVWLYQKSDYRGGEI